MDFVVLPDNNSEEVADLEVQRILIGIDIGGTFTDFVVYYPTSREFDSFKVLSTPANPAEAVIAGLKQVLSKSTKSNKVINLEIIHGSTVATNALLERKGARTALVTTRGFRDVIQIGRQNRPALYDLTVNPNAPLVPGDLRFEVDERVDAQGQILIPLDRTQVAGLSRQLQSLAVDSVAVCLLFSFLRPEHEAEIAQALRSAGLVVSVSYEILPEYREYERTSTTVVNAYVSPILARYLASLEAESLSLLSDIHGTQSEPVRMRVMQSNGGCISLDEARRSGVRCILSGPAGGLIASRFVAQKALAREDLPLTEEIKLLTFDMGGTSTDVSLIVGEPSITTETVLSGCPIHIPVLDIHTIGAGGGSIASVDLGGALRVGPESAGADPGPACYGRGPIALIQPTVTDANLVLGRLAPEYFLGGQMVLSPQRAWEVYTRLGTLLGLNPVQAALGVIEIVNVHMERALRVISVERGFDPQDFTLLSYGGAGGLHAAELARRLGIPRLLIPPLASTFSALGMLLADVVKDYTQTVMFTGDSTPEFIQKAFSPLLKQAIQELQEEGIPLNRLKVEPSLDVRYTGQSYELNIPWRTEEASIPEDFNATHQKTYGYCRPGAPLEIVNLRVRAVGQVPGPPFNPSTLSDTDSSHAWLENRPVIYKPNDGAPSSENSLQPTEVPFYRGEALLPGNEITGPAAVIRSDTTVFMGHGDRAQVDGFRNLLINIRNH